MSKLQEAAKAQPENVLNIQTNAMWMLIEAMPNRQYPNQGEQDKDLSLLVKRIEAYLATKNAFHKA